MRTGAAAVAHDLGLFLLVPAAMALLSVPVATAVGDGHAVPVLLGAGAACLAVGLALVRRFRHVRVTRSWPAVEVVALGWVLTALVAAGVLTGIAHTGPEAGTASEVYRDPMNALFEATSGITSTGLTIAAGLESDLAPVLQWWRSLLQWAGGVGVVLFAAGLAHTAAGTHRLLESEVGNEGIGDPRHTVRTVVRIYGALTVATLLAFQLAFDDGWAALNHGLSAISTGGFTITDDSLAGAGTAGTLVAMVAIVLGATSFVSHHLLLVEHDLGRWWRLSKVRAQAVWLVGGTATVAALNALTGGERVLDSAFQWVTASATAGFSTDPDLAGWATPVLLLLVVAMVVGPPSASTGGGVKLDRVAWLAKTAAVWMRRGERPVRWDGERVPPRRRRRAQRNAAAMLGLWLVTGALGVGVLVATTDAPVLHVSFDVASALGNAGLDLGVVDRDLGAVAKATLTGIMLLGRLELLTALLLATEPETVEDPA